MELSMQTAIIGALTTSLVISAAMVLGLFYLVVKLSNIIVTLELKMPPVDQPEEPMPGPVPREVATAAGDEMLRALSDEEEWELEQKQYGGMTLDEREAAAEEVARIERERRGDYT